MKDTESAKQQPQRSLFRWRFSLRGLLVLVTLCSCGMYGYLQIKLQEKESQTGQAIIDSGVTIDAWRGDEKEPRNIESFTVPFSGPRGPSYVVPWKSLDRLPYLKSVQINSGTIREETLAFLKRCPNLQSIRLRRCRLEVDEESLIWLSERGLVLEPHTRIFKTDFTAAGVKALLKQQDLEIDFNRCSFTDEAIEALDIRMNRQHLSFYFCKNLTAKDLIEAVENQIASLVITEPNDLVLLPKEGREQGAVTWKSEEPIELEENCFKKMRNLKAITLHGRSPNALAAIENLQPYVRVSIVFPAVLLSRQEQSEEILSRLAYQDKVFDTIEATPNLDSLTLWDGKGHPCNARQLRFTPKHRLRKLRIESAQEYDPKFFTELSKLRSLRNLSINNTNVLGLEIEPLIRINYLKSVKLNEYNLSDGALNLLRGWAEKVEFSRP